MLSEETKGALRVELLRLKLVQKEQKDVGKELTQELAQVKGMIETLNTNIHKDDGRIKTLETLLALYPDKEGNTP